MNPMNKTSVRNLWFSASVPIVMADVRVNRSKDLVFVDSSIEDTERHLNGVSSQLFVFRGFPRSLTERVFGQSPRRCLACARHAHRHARRKWDLHPPAERPISYPWL